MKDKERDDAQECSKNQIHKQETERTLDCCYAANDFTTGTMLSEETRQKRAETTK